MAMYKKATFSHKCKVTALNKPKGSGWDIYNLPNQIKTASTTVEGEDLGGFNLKEATTEHPDHLYIKVFAIKKDEPNDNGDAFSEEELKKSAHTFVGVPLFTNHQNDDVEKARGECVHSWYDEKDGGIYIIGRVDKVAYPRLARGIEENYISGTSMGCFLGHNRVLMGDGEYKSIYKIKKGDEVITHKGRVRKVKNLQVHEDKTNDLIYKIKVEGLPNEICATKEHPLYVLKEQNTCFITGDHIGTPKSVKNKFRRRTKSGVYQTEEYQVALKRGDLNKFDFEWKRVADIKEGDMVSFPISKEVIEDNEATIDKARLIGYFLAEGSYLKYKGNRTAVEFNFCLSKEKETLGKEVIGLLRKVFDTPLEPKIQERPDRDIFMIRLYGKDIAKWFFKYCGEYSHKKRLNEKCLFWNTEIQKHILATWINGDGTCRNIYHKNGKLYQNVSGTTCSEVLHNQMKFIASRLGIYSTTEQIKEKAIKRGRKPYWNLVFGCKESQKLNDVLGVDRVVEGEYSDSWFRQADDYIVMPIKKIETEYNIDPVYNIEVEEDHSYIVEGVIVKNCSVENSICSVCHNNANTSEDYCSHIANRKNRKYTGDIKCAYHNSPTDKKDKCPICGSTAEDTKIIKHSEQPIFEHNYGLKFIENSFVVNPACPDCGVRCVLNASTIKSKVASFNETIGNLIKESHLQEEDSEIITKLGGVQELQSLKNSMDELEKVTQSMLKQKENVSMEYVSQIVKAMADIQDFYDELTEMGYGALPSPPVTASENNALATDGQLPESPPPAQMAAQQAPPPPPPAVGSQTSDLGGLGNITLPKNSSRKIEDFSERSQKLIDKVSSLDESLQKINDKINSQLGIGAKMATNNKTTKVAAGVDNLDIITEKQLMKEESDTHARTGEVYEGITESKEQIGGSEKSNETTSSSPQVRTGTYETTTEDQLKTQSALGDAVIHFNDYPDVITEKQWDDFSRDVAGNLPDDYTESITQAQIRDILSNHKFIGNVETITEDQLKNVSMTDGLKRWANKGYSISLVKTASNIVADMIAIYHKSPEEIKKIASIVSDDSEMKAKVSFLAVLNSLSHKKESRESVASNESYFSKTASKGTMSTVDALILSIASNAQFGMKSEDVIDTVSHISNSPKQMTKVNSIVYSRINKISDSKIVTKAAALESAIKEMDKPEDGRYQIRATMEDIGAPITDKVAFVNGVKKFAQEMIDDDSVAAAVIKIEVGDNGELIIDIQDGGEEEIVPDDIGDIIEGPIEAIDADINGECDEEECNEEGIEEVEEVEEDTDDCMAEAKAEIKKTAQMMGGEMGGQGGASQAPGAGATLPGAPGLGAPPMESFTEEPGMGEEDEELTDNLEPLPPGSICPVCGSDDVNVLDGKGKCGNCGSEMTYKIEINVTKWQGITPSESGEGEEEVEEGFEGEGFEMPSEESLGEGPGNMEQEMGEIPAAASINNLRPRKFAATVRILPQAVKKVSEAKIKVGSISPATGKSNTVDLGDGNHICLDTGTKYKVAYMVSKNGKKVYAQWEWVPRSASSLCPSCDRAKQKFVKALSSVKMTEASFDKLDLKEQVATIIKLKQAGALKTIKTASKEGSVLSDYKLAYGGYGDKFPIESCIEKLARRFGANAVCLSGPDEGKALAESVCNRLKKADVYTTKIAIKLADNWSDCDGDEECITHQVRSGYSLRQAAEVCSTLKIAVAEEEDFLTDEIAGEDAFNETPDVPVEIDMEDEVEVDPFEGGIEEEEHGATVTLELPIDLVEQLEQAIEVAEGEGQEGIEEEAEEGEILGEEPPMDDSGFEGEVSTEAPIEEIGPDDFSEDKPAIDPEEGGEIKPSLVGFEAEQDDESNILEKNKGIPTGTSKLIVNDHTKDKEDTFAMEKNVGKVGKTQMDLTSVINAINKIAGEKEISQSKAQDSSDIGTYTAGEGGSQMGHENETIPSTQKPSVPRNNATMGQEPSDLNPQDKPQPVIPSDKATMGHEDEAGLSGGDNTYTGGDKGQGKTELAHSKNARIIQGSVDPASAEQWAMNTGDPYLIDGVSNLIQKGNQTGINLIQRAMSGDETAKGQLIQMLGGRAVPISQASIDEDLMHMKGFGSSKAGISSLADRIAKKLAPKEPVADDPDIKPIYDGGTIGKEEKFDAEEINESEVKSDSGMIGHEKETLGDKPDSPKDHPDVFTGNAQQGNEELDSEKTTKNKGTVIANSDSESEAIRVAGRMLQAKQIQASELPTKIRELREYKPEQIKDIEKAIFAKKGLNTVSDGMSQTVQINETSSVRNAQDDIRSGLKSLFTLDKQNKIADSDDLAQVRKTYNK